MSDLDRKVAQAMGLKSVNNCEKWGEDMSEEDEAFNEIEKRSKVKQELISSMNRKRQIMSVNPYRDQVIEEVAQHIEKLKSFGQPTVDGLAIYIRSMK